MMTLPDTVQPQSDLSDRFVALNLTLKSKEVITLRSCEVLGRGFRNRVSFNEARTIEDVLVESLTSAIRSCLQTLPDGKHVLSLPDFFVEIPGLALSGAQVVVMEAKDGIRNAIFRFKHFVGAINNAFSADIGFHNIGSSHSEKLAVNVLAEICLPILNLCRSFEAFSFGDDPRKALDLADRAREFEFQTELLKRFIFNAGTGTGHADAAGAYLQSDDDKDPSQTGSTSTHRNMVIDAGPF